MTAKVMFSLPDQLVSRMKASIPAGECSKVAAALLEKEILVREMALYHCAKELESCLAAQDEVTIWENEFGNDGLDDV